VFGFDWGTFDTGMLGFNLDRATLGSGALFAALHWDSLWVQTV
tara:strand:+ start:4489 stop:4617 length:129 start_codon:yes stop_codon:yes gene_type:complete